MRKWFIPLLVVGLIFGAGLLMRYWADGRDARGATRLMRSLESGADTRETDRLIARAGDVNVGDNEGHTALFMRRATPKRFNRLKNCWRRGQTPTGRIMTAKRRYFGRRSLTPMTLLPWYW